MHIHFLINFYLIMCTLCHVASFSFGLYLGPNLQSSFKFSKKGLDNGFEKEVQKKKLWVIQIQHSPLCM